MKTKNFKFKSMALVLFALVLSSNVWGAEVTSVYSTGFEKCSTGTNYQGTVTIESEKGDGASWTIYYGCVSTSSKISGNNSAQMRLYSNGNCGYMEQTSNIATVDSINFTYAVSNKAVRFDVKYSTNSGSSWTTLASIAPSGTTATTLAYRLSAQAATFRLKIEVTGGHPSSSNYTFRVDDVNYYKIAASCTNKVTVTKNSATGGTYTLKAGSASGAEIADGGTVDNCDANATIVVVPNADSHYHCTGVTASKSTSVTGPDGSGNYTITYTQGSSINSTINVTFAEDPKHTISFQDNIQLEDVASQEVYDGATFEFPVLTDKTATTEGTCKEEHYHFMGWVISTHTGEITVGDIKTGTSGAVSADATYKAVWAKEDE